MQGQSEKVWRKFSRTDSSSHETISQQSSECLLLIGHTFNMLCFVWPNRRTASPELFSCVPTRRLLSRPATWLCLAPKRCTQSGDLINPVHFKIQGSLRNDERDRLRKSPLKSEFALPQTLSRFRFHPSLSPLPPAPPLHFAPTTQATNGSSPFTDDKFPYKLHKRKIWALPWLNNVFYKEVKCFSVVCFSNITFCTTILW